VSTLSERLHRAAAYGPHDWLLAVEAWLELARAEAGLRLDRPEAIRRALARGRRPAADDRDLPPQLLEMFLLASRHHLFEVSSLPKAIALARMLERRKLSPTLRIGARRDGSTLHGHAWVEVDGVPFNDSADVADRHEPLSAEDFARMTESRG
jgi:hypothetical protein